ncbi:MAG: glycosyltransferase family 2 protein [Desulfovibrio sp.]|nr:glycosyltransferase family 2 protein [Desulfovibrio sp.]
MQAKNVGVVILNYNGWQDTIACAESVLASTVPPAWLIIVDNASTDDSVRWFRHWAAGRIDFALQDFGAPACSSKPLVLTEVTEGEYPALAQGSIVLLHANSNRGYAAGNNAGMRLLLHLGADAVWILNNDTVVHKDALGAMVARLFSKKRPGLCGSLIQYMDEHGLVQCRAGGFTNKWTGLSVLNGSRLPLEEAQRTAPEAVEQHINFIYGASVMASRAFIEKVGPLDERFFLYCEEQDWAYSAADQFDLAYAPEAVVHHREGGSTGFSNKSCTPVALWRLTRSRLQLAAKHCPLALPTVCLCIVYAACRMVVRRIRLRAAYA